MNSDNIARARQVAAYAHDGQYRKGTTIPYYTHPLAVSEIVAEFGGSEDAIIAALFHDILEDVPTERYSEAQMRLEFGERVVEIVTLTSENKRADDAETAPWTARKENYLEHLGTLEDPEALLVTTADKVHNLASTLADLHEVGDLLWERFNAPREQQLWYYTRLQEVLSGKQLPRGLQDRFAAQVAELTRG